MGIDPYITHFPILGAALASVNGPILECGLGDGSTPLIHYSAKWRDLEVVSLDNDSKWLTRFSNYANRYHQFIEIDSGKNVTESIAAWQKCPILEQCRWGLAFIDCAPGEVRHLLAARLKDNADLIICHDSETDHGAGGNYQYDKIKPLFKHVSEFRRFRPYTLILSNSYYFPIEECDKEWKP